MSLQRMKPTSPGRRFVVRVLKEGLSKKDPHKPLVRGRSATGGRGAGGRISVRHQGGGHKRRYRQIDFRREKYGIPAQVESMEYDPFRSAHLALLLYADGERRYILATEGMAVGTSVISSRDQLKVRSGSAFPLSLIPVGTGVCCVEMKPGKGAQLARSAGATVRLISVEGRTATLRLTSGEMRTVPADCMATIGQIGNVDHSLAKLGKAGASRWRGIRPTVRGVAMNPVDHPHGGGEGRSSGGRHPSTPTGKPTKGYRTRNNPRTDPFIVRRRYKK